MGKITWEIFKLEASPVEGQSLPQKDKKRGKKKGEKKIKKKNENLKDLGHFQNFQVISAHTQTKML